MADTFDIAALIHSHRDEDHRKIREVLEGMKDPEVVELLK